jgi:endonuclease/exonuclease/phosphatase family metal-dependent hydrolase
MFLVALFFVSALSQDPWPEVKVGVWNVMQQPWIGTWTDQVNNHIATTDLDILHLVEIWTDRERDAILNNPAIRTKYPFHYTPSVRNERCGCNITSEPELAKKIQDFLGCAMLNGIDIRQLIQPYPNPLPAICNWAGMAIALNNLNPSNFICLSCVINTAQNLPQGLSPEVQISTVINTCASKVGDKYSYKGVNGQLILSKFQIRDVREAKFNGWLANRINIHATIRNIRFVFGHFAYNVIEDFMPDAKGLMYGDTQFQQAQEIAVSLPDVVVGDLNTGPDYQPDGYNLLLQAGFKSVFEVQPQTYCSPSHVNFTMCVGMAPQSIDHIMIRNTNFLRSKNAEIFNDLPLMSDHVGVKAVVSKRP